MQIAEWKCAVCGETVEKRFKRCWNCGATEEGEPDPAFETADDAVVSKPDGHWSERVAGLWALALLTGLLAAYLASRQRSIVFAVAAVICFGYLAVQCTAWWLVQTARRIGQ